MQLSRLSVKPGDHGLERSSHSESIPFDGRRTPSFTDAWQRINSHFCSITLFSLPPPSHPFPSYYSSCFSLLILLLLFLFIVILCFLCLLFFFLFFVLLFLLLSCSFCSSSLLSPSSGVGSGTEVLESSPRSRYFLIGQRLSHGTNARWRPSTQSFE